ncbi:phage terminase large subunit family protein [Rickettsiales bacterium]|nr:phage terminase large subunit family protein [Rickettsiales bacterium]
MKNYDDLYFKSFCQGLKPDPNFNVSQWADNHRILTSVSSAEPGPWRTDRTPYLKEIMDCLSPSNPCEKVVFMKGAQIGGTECGNNWMGFVIHHAPGPMLIVNPTVETAKRTSKMRIDPAIENCPALKEKVQDPRSRDSGNTMLMKEFPGGVLILTGANSAVGLRSMPIRYLFLDEVDGYPDDAASEGDPVNLAIQRTATFSNKKIFMISTPTIKNYSRIETAFLEGDQRYYFVPCPDCSEFQILKWSNVKWPKGDPESAYYKCKKCGSKWEDHQKAEILMNGKWIAQNPNCDSKTISFHLSSLYSPHGWVSFGDIAKEFSEVHKDPPRLQVWTNTKLAKTWEDMSGEAIDPTGLLKRRENFGKHLPKDVAIITAGVDVQDNRLELEIVGWGKDEESWSLDYQVIYGDPSTPDLWNDLDKILSNNFTHSRDLGNFAITAVAVDSGGHYTDHVINYCDERKYKRFWAIKGSSNGNGVPIWPVRASQSKRLKKPVYVIGVNDAKETLMQRLRIENSGAGYWHFPIERDQEWFNQITSEVIKTKYVKGRPTRTWQPRKEGIATEGLDCRVYAFAALRGLIRNWKLDLNKLAHKLSEIPLRNSDAPIMNNKFVANSRSRRVRSKGIN